MSCAVARSCRSARPRMSAVSDSTKEIGSSWRCSTASVAKMVQAQEPASSVDGDADRARADPREQLLVRVVVLRARWSSDERGPGRSANAFGLPGAPPGRRQSGSLPTPPRRVRDARPATARVQLAAAPVVTEKGCDANDGVVGDPGRPAGWAVVQWSTAPLARRRAARPGLLTRAAAPPAGGRVVGVDVALVVVDRARRCGKSLKPQKSISAKLKRSQRHSMRPPNSRSLRSFHGLSGRSMPTTPTPSRLCAKMPLVSVQTRSAVKGSPQAPRSVGWYWSMLAANSSAHVLERADVVERVHDARRPQRDARLLEGGQRGQRQVLRVELVGGAEELRLAPDDVLEAEPHPQPAVEHLDVDVGLLQLLVVLLRLAAVPGAVRLVEVELEAVEVARCAASRSAPLLGM